MDYRALFKGSYLAAVEFNGRTPTFTIKAVQVVTMEDDKGGSEDRGVVFFTETDRGLVLNKTNAILIAAMFGNETREWHGKRITLHSVPVKFGRETVPGIRVLGSPDIGGPLSVPVKLPKRRAKDVRLERTQ